MTYFSFTNKLFAFNYAFNNEMLIIEIEIKPNQNALCKYLFMANRFRFSSVCSCYFNVMLSPPHNPISFVFDCQNIEIPRNTYDYISP